FSTGVQALNFCAVPSMLLFSRFSRRWRVVPKSEKTTCKDVMYLAMGSLLFMGLFSSYFYFNATIYSQGEKVKLRDAVGYFIRSPMFEEFKSNAYKIFNETRHDGFRKGWESFIELMDPFGTHYALKVLELPQNSTQAEIKERVRTLSKKWHPDKHVEEEDKIAAQEKFVEIQKAGEVLLEEKKRRARSNKKNVEPEPDPEF
ncbi:DnaJ domain, partial [Trinorchestia longiramus]